MDLRAIFSDITRRVPNSVISSRFVREGNIIAGRSAEKTLTKVEEIIEKGEPNQLLSLYNVAGWYINDFRLHGEKATYFYEIDETIAEEIICIFSNKTLQANIFSDAYPTTLRIEDEALDNEVLRKYQLMAVEDYDDGLALTLSTFRFYTEQVELRPDDLLPPLRERYSDIEKFVGTKKRFSQFFDIVVIWPDGRVELRVDNPQKDGLKPLPFKERKEAIKKLTIEFNTLVSEALDHRWELPDPFNLIHVVDNIYREQTEGYVRELCFITTNSNSKSSKANWKDKDDCCREDVFIKAGTAGVNGNIFPYRLMVSWPHHQEIYPHLQIFGTVHCVDSGNKVICEAIIKNCQTQADYQYVRDKVLKYYEQGRSEQFLAHISR